MQGLSQNRTLPQGMPVQEKGSREPPQDDDDTHIDKIGVRQPNPPRPRKVPIHLEAAFKEEVESLVKLGILEEVKEHTDWVNSCDCGKRHWKSPLNKSYN